MDSVLEGKMKEILNLHKKWLNGKKDGVKADLTGADLTRANLTWVNLTGANLTRANLTWADLTGANLTWADLTGANLTWANLTWANLTRANLTRANLTWADLTGANLTRADLTGANLTRANLDFSCWPLWCGSLKVGKIDDRLALQLLAHVARLPVEGLSPEVAELITGLPELAKNGFCEHRGEVNLI